MKNQKSMFKPNLGNDDVMILLDEKIADIVIPGRIITKKNTRVYIPLPAKASSFYYFYKKKGMKPVRVISVPNVVYKKWEKETRLLFNKHYPELQPTKENVLVGLDVFYRGQQPDLSGSQESIGDCFEGFLWENDKQIKKWVAATYHDKTDPRVEVSVYLLKEKL